ncbi:rhomboid family intramembrane serine protease [Halosquirtibacter laminarini]|uniref:Rhomboid family intramembrane serine protease n=1 Tax=Halosquirtibacter laminarini TaxID=3374600 RepID=A0AC61NR29_9BACT|nr:rhomboid family intramembrane serine protease [Prolixibacteraceae bacterium]
MGILNELRNAFKNGGYLTKLIYINVIVFFVIRGIDVILFLGGQPLGLIVNYLSLPDSWAQLIKQPWSLFTYMFTHYGFIHLFSNLLFLYWFGRIFLQYLDQNKLIYLYIIGGLMGGILYFIAFNTLPVFANSTTLLLGASAAVFSIVVATAVYIPNYQLYLMFIGPVRIKYIAIIYVVLSTIMIASENPGGNIAHLGGALCGYLYIHYYRKGKDIGAWIYPLIDKVMKLCTRSTSNLKVKYKKDVTKMNDKQYNRSKKQKQEETNRVLDKISKSGYDSLSKEEKNHLFKMGRK